MVKIEWHYDNGESRFFIDQEQVMNGRLYQYFQQPLETSTVEIIEILREVVNSDVFIIEFHGVKQYYAIIKEYLELDYENTLIQLQWVNIEDEVANYANEIERLKTIVATSKIEAWKTEKIARQLTSFESLTATFYVVATMSAGKSTVLNAMLGEPLLPTDHLASTAKLMRIKQKNTSAYSATAYDASKRTLAIRTSVTKEDLEEWNKNEDVDEIIIEGPILHNDAAITIELVDTPGPNNSQDLRHRAKIEHFIQTAEHPILLYIMDATKIGTDDDAAYMLLLKEWFEQAQLNIAERTYFLLNKVDEFDTPEDVGRTLQTVREFLAKYTIQQPKIYPISAQYALLYRQQQQGHTLTSRQQRSLAIMEDVFSDLQLLNHATLSSKVKAHWEEKMDVFLKQQALLARTGLLILEETLTQFVKNEAFTQQAKIIVEELIEKAQVEQQVIIDRYEAERMKLSEVFYELELDYTQRAKKVEKYYQKVTTKIEEAIAIIANEWKTPSELINEAQRKSESDFRAKMNSFLYAQNQENSDEAPNDLLVLLEASKNGDLFYSDQQYQFLKQHTLIVLYQVTGILQGLIDTSSPVQEVLKTQLQLVEAIIDTLESDLALSEFPTAKNNKGEVKSPEYLKSVANLYFMSMKEWLQNQMEYWTDIIIGKETLASYYKQHFGEGFPAILDEKRNQFEVEYQVVLDKEQQQIEQFEQSTMALNDWYRQLVQEMDI